MYLKSKDIAEELNVSEDTARRIMFTLPHFRMGEGRRAVIRVSREDFDAYVANHMKQPGEAPRATPFKTERQERNDTVKEWHKARRAAR